MRTPLSDDANEALAVMDRLAAGGVDIDDVTRVLEDDGIEKFVKSFDGLLGVIATKRRALATQAPPKHSGVVGSVDVALGKRLLTFEQWHVTKRVWARDATVWKDDPDTPEIRDRLGWLTVGKAMAQQVKSLTAFADEVRAEFGRVVLCGMGGSSLAPEVLWQTFGAAPEHPSLHVLDSTDPRAVQQVEQEGDLARTLFIISSKSGTTQESDSFFRYFWERSGRRGSQFVAITDPGTPLERLASERGFRRAFLNPSDIGGRYSALSYFGLVPAALIGVDVGRLLHRAHRMAEACAPSVTELDSPGAWLGAILGEAALAGRDKATFVLSPRIASFGLWAEQLIAESTGKEGRGILPVAGEALGSPDVYGTDRMFISMTLAGEEGTDVDSRLAALGTTAIRWSTCVWTTHDLGRSSSAGEFATAVARHPCCDSTRSTSPTSLRARRTPRRCWRSGARPRRPSARSSSAPGRRAAGGLSRADGVPRRPRKTIAGSPPSGFGCATGSKSPPPWYGPRYLHSTGQLHKGGPPVGHFPESPSRRPRMFPFPASRSGFRELEAAQAEGDLWHSGPRGRPAVGSTILGCSSGDHHARVLRRRRRSRQQRLGPGRARGDRPAFRGSTWTSWRRCTASRSPCWRWAGSRWRSISARGFYRPRPFTIDAFKSHMLSLSQPFPETIALAHELARTGRYRLMTLNNESAEAEPAPARPLRPAGHLRRVLLLLLGRRPQAGSPDL